MRHSGTFTRLKRAIELRIYEEKEDYIEKMDSFLIYKRINQDEYDELLAMLNKTYPTEE